ncbi:hypothetical protein E2C01_052472 [Portunus trituberculatus]|uniref:Uncharacterized protein n=1 Tax=Portunus trituberculatus TaxID=210409 RepID=A0A5B7GMJ5_PORTR|nr:hypothetical protein [Portunus trituberculatus]
MACPIPGRPRGAASLPDALVLAFVLLAAITQVSVSQPCSGVLAPVPQPSRAGQGGFVYGIPLVELPRPAVPASRRTVVWGMACLLAVCIQIACLNPHRATVTSRQRQDDPRQRQAFTILSVARNSSMHGWRGLASAA